MPERESETHTMYAINYELYYWVCFSLMNEPFTLTTPPPPPLSLPKQLQEGLKQNRAGQSLGSHCYWGHYVS